MKVKDIVESGVYLLTGPEEDISLIPTENILYVYPEKVYVIEGRDALVWEGIWDLECVCLAKSSDYPIALGSIKEFKE